MRRKSQTFEQRVAACYLKAQRATDQAARVLAELNMDESLLSLYYLDCLKAEQRAKYNWSVLVLHIEPQHATGCKEQACLNGASCACWCHQWKRLPQ